MSYPLNASSIHRKVADFGRSMIQPTTAPVCVLNCRSFCESSKCTLLYTSVVLYVGTGPNDCVRWRFPRNCALENLNSSSKESSTSRLFIFLCIVSRRHPVLSFFWENPQEEVPVCHLLAHILIAKICRHPILIMSLVVPEAHQQFQVWIVCSYIDAFGLSLPTAHSSFTEHQCRWETKDHVRVDGD
jgi:hypothetical protein